jgi:hypothetical protein
MARLVHCKAVLLLQTDVRTSATRAAIWRAQQCLQEWERLGQLGMTSGLGEDEQLDLQCLEAWCRAAAADMLLLEALRGAPLLPLQPLAEVLPQAVSFDAGGGAPTLRRPAGSGVVQQLQAALAAAKPHASEHIVRVAEAVAGHLQAEISAGDRLRDMLLPRRCGSCVSGNTVVPFALLPTAGRMHRQDAVALLCQFMSSTCFALILPAYLTDAVSVSLTKDLYVSASPFSHPALQRRHERGGAHCSHSSGGAVSQPGGGSGAGAGAQRAVDQAS